MKTSAACLLLVLAACGKRKEDDPPVQPPPAAVPVAAVAHCDPPGHACVGEDLIECRADGTLGATLQTCKAGCKRGACVDTCATHGVELIYVVDSDNNLSSFDPSKLPGDPFQLVGKLTCDPTGAPFSMAVDRTGIAWVLYDNGHLFRVSILDGHCTPAGAIPEDDAPTTFGMGFVSDGPKAETEKLYLAGNDDAQNLAVLDTSTDTPHWKTVGPIKAKQSQNPELTGTGEGKLFGYFPEPGRGFVQELDRSSGKPVGARLSLGPTTGRIHSYAFAHWGGVFYIFATADTSAVHAVHRKNGKYELLLDNLPHPIVGAGVSTCAPLLERAPE